MPSILTNEKYKRDALLQKVYTTDFLTKKKKKNEGEVPQYYVEGNHEAIIEPEIFDRVQILMQARLPEKNRRSSVSIFSGKIRCGDCGGWYGSKIWHGKFYIFYHRMTDKSTYSRQACAGEIQIGADGHIDQVEMSNSGLNGKALPAAGEYPAAIACVLKRGHMPHVVNGKLKRKIPCISFPNGQAEISDIKDRTVIGYRSFHFDGGEKIQLEMTGDFRGEVQISVELYGKAAAKAAAGQKCEIQFPKSFAEDHPIYFTFRGTGTAQLHTIRFL